MSTAMSKPVLTIREIPCRHFSVAQLQAINLREALLCVDCEVIYPATTIGNNSTCPNCNSASYLKLSSILNRE